MKILYVITTCGKHLDTRILWQYKSWLYRVSEKDFVLLSEKSVATKVIGYDTPEGYNYVPYKYSSFLRQYERFLEFDWVFFCDDDTFVYENRLKGLLKNYDENESIIIGRLGEYHGYQHASGGAGFAATSGLVLKIKKYLLTKEFEYFINSDTSLCMWAKKADSNIKFIDNENLHCQHPEHESVISCDRNEAISYHYCSKEQFESLRQP